MARVGRPKGTGTGLPKGGSIPFEERVKDFWSKVSIGDGCWEWSGMISSSHGYGVFCYSGKTITAHRFSWLVTHGKFPDKPYVCHRCDNKKCVRPDHLFEGTPTDNNQDCAQKGRRQDWGSPKQTPEQVFKIRQLYATGDYSYVELARHLGTTLTRVRCALNKWKTLEKYAKT